MTPRQQKAAAIDRALRKEFGEAAAVINALPLSSDQQLRIQVVDAKRDAFVEKMCGWGWLPNYLQIHHRVSTATHSLIPAAIFEVKIEEERKPIPVEMPRQRIHGEVAERKKTDAEVQAVQKYLGLR